MTGNGNGGIIAYGRSGGRGFQDYGGGGGRGGRPRAQEGGTKWLSWLFFFITFGCSGHPNAYAADSRSTRRDREYGGGVTGSSRDLNSTSKESRRRSSGVNIHAAGGRGGRLGGGGGGGVTVVNNYYGSGVCAPLFVQRPIKFSKAIVLDRYPAVPYKKGAYVPSQMTPFKVIVKGTCSSNPSQFAINIADDTGYNLLHFNQRWAERRALITSKWTYLGINDPATSWKGQTQYAFFKTFVPNGTFKVEITFKNQQFIVNVNNEDPVAFVPSQDFRGTLRKIKINKAERKDIRLNSVQLLY